jgi:hypothetical protein
VRSGSGDEALHNLDLEIKRWLVNLKLQSFDLQANSSRYGNEGTNPNRELNSEISGYIVSHFADKHIAHKYEQRHTQIEDSTIMCNFHSILCDKLHLIFMTFNKELSIFLQIESS